MPTGSHTSVRTPPSAITQSAPVAWAPIRARSSTCNCACAVSRTARRRRFGHASNHQRQHHGGLDHDRRARRRFHSRRLRPSSCSTPANAWPSMPRSTCFATRCAVSSNVTSIQPRPLGRAGHRRSRVLARVRRGRTAVPERARTIRRPGARLPLQRGDRRGDQLLGSTAGIGLQSDIVVDYIHKYGSEEQRRSTCRP